MLLVFDVNFFFYFLVLEKTLIEIKKKKGKEKKKTEIGWNATSEPFKSSTE